MPGFHDLMLWTVLAVDDEPAITDLARRHLERAGFEVQTASSGRAALELIRARPPDLLLLDLMLPDIDGFGLCEMLRRDPESASIPVVILTAWSTPEARALGFDLGVLAYITKPFSPQALVAEVNRLVHGSAAPCPAMDPGTAVRATGDPRADAPNRLPA